MELERDKVRQREPQETTAPEGGSGNLDCLREVGADFLTAGDEAINRALSRNSEAFLAANRQQGGQ